MPRRPTPSLTKGSWSGPRSLALVSTGKKVKSNPHSQGWDLDPCKFCPILGHPTPDRGIREPQLKKISVADPGWLSRITDPTFCHPGSEKIWSGYAGYGSAPLHTVMGTRWGWIYHCISDITLYFLCRQQLQRFPGAGDHCRRPTALQTLLWQVSTCVICVSDPQIVPQCWGASMFIPVSGSTGYRWVFTKIWLTFRKSEFFFKNMHVSNNM